MSEVLMYTTTLITMTCGACHIPFAIPENLYEVRLNDGADFYCPNGHNIHYSDSRNKKLQREKEALEHQLRYARTARQSALDQADAAERRRRAAKGQLTKVKRRVANGVCPCCNRTFVDLGRHMAGKHPDFVAALVPVGGEPQ